MKMTKYMRFLVAAASTACILAIAGCASIQSKPGIAQRVVGAWLVKMPEAPFPYHMLIFNADGTMLQSNPDAGDPRTSDSNGFGAWVVDGDRIVGKFVEVTADRTTHKFVARGEIAFHADVDDDTIHGTGKARFYDEHDSQLGDEIPFTLSGSRIRAK